MHHCINEPYQELMGKATQMEESSLPEDKLHLILSAANIGKQKSRRWYKIPWIDAVEMVGERKFHMEHGKRSK